MNTRKQMLICRCQHYDFYYFIVNRCIGPGGKPIFNYSNEPPKKPTSTNSDGLTTTKDLPDINTLEGAGSDPALTKVVDRRWYQRNKHIYPASTWQMFDPETDYAAEVRRDAGGNAYFFSQ